MSKIRLELDRVTLESFPTSEAIQPDTQGTVHAAMPATRAGPTCQTSCYPYGDPACTCPVP
ncbi:MAG TPA: hypothetical protein VF771_00905 [Longimicrobiaceae bacterium]